MPSLKWLFGIFLLLLVVLIWVISSTTIQYIFEEQKYDHPYFLTYFNTTLFMLYLSGFLFFPEWRGSAQWIIKKEFTLPFQDCFIKKTQLDPDTDENPNNPILMAEDSDEPKVVHLNWKQTAKISLLFCPIWFLANYNFNLGLELTSVSSSTILSTTSSFFTLIIGVATRVETFSWGKLFAIIICLCGVITVSILDQQESSNPLVGDLLTLASAVSYAAYTVFLKKMIPDERTVSMPMLFGFVGLFNMFLMMPFLFVLHYTNLELFEFPTGYVLLSLSLNAIIGTVLSDLIWSLSLLYTSPLIATMGLSLTIPLAMVADLIRQKRDFKPLYILGSLLVFVGFALVNITNKEKEKKIWEKIKGKICVKKSQRVVNDNQINE